MTRAPGFATQCDGGCGSIRRLPKPGHWMCDRCLWAPVPMPVDAPPLKDEPVTQPCHYPYYPLTVPLAEQLGAPEVYTPFPPAEPAPGEYHRSSPGAPLPEVEP